MIDIIIAKDSISIHTYAPVHGTSLSIKRSDKVCNVFVCLFVEVVLCPADSSELFSDYFKVMLFALILCHRGGD